MKRFLVGVGLAAALAGGAVTPVVAVGSASGTFLSESLSGSSSSGEVSAVLTGAVLPLGEPGGIVQYDTRGGDGSRKLEVDVVAPGMNSNTLNLYLNGSALDGVSVVLNQSGQGEVKLDTRDGVQVPEVQSGDEVELRRFEGGVVLSGTFR